MRRCMSLAAQALSGQLVAEQGPSAHLQPLPHVHPEQRVASRLLLRRLRLMLHGHWQHGLLLMLCLLAPRLRLLWDRLSHRLPGLPGRPSPAGHARLHVRNLLLHTQVRQVKAAHLAALPWGCRAVGGCARCSCRAGRCRRRWRCVHLLPLLLLLLLRGLPRRVSSGGGGLMQLLLPALLLP